MAEPSLILKSFPYPQQENTLFKPQGPHIPSKVSMHLPHSSARLCSPPAVSTVRHPRGPQLGQPLPQQRHPSAAGSLAPDVPSGYTTEEGKSEVAEKQRIRTVFAEIYLIVGPST